MVYAYSRNNLEAWLSLAKEAAREAGKLLLASTGSSKAVVEGEQGRDIKLELDWKSEDCILKVLGKGSGFTILSEECGIRNASAAGQGLRWIVDPLDGSFNYRNGIALCCVSVGLWREDEPVLGVIYDFNRNELFTGVVGFGAWLNERSITVSSVDQPRQAVLCTGFPTETDFSSEGLMRFVGQVRQYKKIRLFGSAALSLAYVASGRADAYYEQDIRVWDVAAGLAIVQAAGGEVIRTDSSVPEALTVYADNSYLPRPF